MRYLAVTVLLAAAALLGQAAIAQPRSPGLLAPSLPAPSLLAQDEQPPNVTFPGPGKREAAVKTVSGQVVNAQGAKLPDALVHLTNNNTHEEITISTDEDGKYSFRDLDRNDDYELRAEYKGVSSPAKTVSSFDNRDEIYLQLEVPSK